MTDTESSSLDIQGAALKAFNSETQDEVVHADVYILHLAEDLDLVLKDEMPDFSNDDSPRIDNVWELPTSATAKFSFESGSIVGYMTLLKQPPGKWIVISVVYSDVFIETKKPITPEAMTGALEACWDGYCVANRARDGVAMSKVFHPLCRLTYATEEPDITIVSSEAFCDKVAHRYENPPHEAFAFCQDEMDVVGQHDTMMGVDMVTPDLGFVTLKVGHPPMLWTDLLTCARLNDGAWWIVAKSSSAEPFHVG